MSKKIASILLVSLLFFTSACSLLSTRDGSEETEAAEAESTDAPIYVIVTSTVASTPQSPLALSHCLFNDDCPNAFDVDDELGNNVESDVVYDVTLPLNEHQEVLVTNGWVSIDQATLDENLSKIRWIFEIDGYDYYEDWMLGDATVPQAGAEDNMIPGTWLGVLVSGWKAGETHTIRIGYVFEQAFNDGWDDYPAGYSNILTYVITPE